MVTELRETAAEGTVPGTGFTKAHQLFRESVRKFIDQEINPYVDAWEEAGMFPRTKSSRRPATWDSWACRTPRNMADRADYWYNMALAEELAGQRRLDPDGHGSANRHGHAGAQPIWVARAQEAVSRAGNPRRCGLLDRSDRAGGGFRRRGDPYQGRTARRRVRDQRQQDVHHEWSAGRLALRAGSHDARNELQGNVTDHRAGRHAGIFGEQETEKARQLGQRYGRVGIRQRSRSGGKPDWRRGPGFSVSDAAVPERAARQRLGFGGRGGKDSQNDGRILPRPDRHSASR